MKDDFLLHGFSFITILFGVLVGTTVCAPATPYKSNVCSDCNIDDDHPSCETPTVCDGDTPLCMTSFYDDGQLHLTDVKRCASVAECSDLWWNQTRLRSDCMDQDPYSWPGDKSGECHYCCYTPKGESRDWCNKAMWPTKPKNLVDMSVTTTVTPTTRNVSSVVRAAPYVSNVCSDCNIDDDHPSCATSTVCDGDTPLCMTSFYDDGQLHLTDVKRCASVAECSDLWWNQTRLRSDCMDQDPYSWPGDKSGECHYCCYTPKGESRDWCNKAMWPTKPKNLVDMSTTTTVTPTTTTTTTMLPTTTTSSTTTSSTTTTKASTESAIQQEETTLPAEIMTTAAKETEPTGEFEKHTTESDTLESTTEEEGQEITDSTTEPETMADLQKVVGNTADAAPEDTQSTTNIQTDVITTETDDKPTPTIGVPPGRTISCVQCGDVVSGEPCGAMDILTKTSSTCPAGLEFCMSDVFHDDALDKTTIFKRCVNEDECRKLWWDQSSDSTECTEYDPNNSRSTQIQCHFCCTTDGCNEPTKPDYLTLWTPYYKGWKDS